MLTKISASAVSNQVANQKRKMCIPPFAKLNPIEMFPKLPFAKLNSREIFFPEG